MSDWAGPWSTCESQEGQVSVHHGSVLPVTMPHSACSGKLCQDLCCILSTDPASMGHTAHIEARGQFAETSFLLPCGSWESNLGLQAWWQAFLPTEPSCWPKSVPLKPKSQRCACGHTRAALGCFLCPLSSQVISADTAQLSCWVQEDSRENRTSHLVSSIPADLVSF